MISCGELDLKDCGTCLKVRLRWECSPLSGIRSYIEVFSARLKRFLG